MVDLRSYEPSYAYTDDPVEPPAPYDGSMPLEVYRHLHERYMRIEYARRNPMLKALGPAGRPLYVLTESGRIKRTSTVRPTVKRAVAERDGACVWCGDTGPYEIDHIVRYVDGGSNEADNLRRLCVTCHRSRGGRA